ncbi:hypothetical protein PR048_011741 [Dryococelus australis]|uniref:Uncharacterized protein n=1 Tax=Dryococelus australis TaxID=614101 RepID=A0ABQ9HMH2_9NEOP|nr:hypothetical protein PR048_011741 [Dryococelus australis]
MEKSLADRLKLLERHVFGLTQKELRLASYSYALKCDIEVPHFWKEIKMVVKDCCLGFRRLHGLSLRKPEGLSKETATGVNKEAIGKKEVISQTSVERGENVTVVAYSTPLDRTSRHWSFLGEYASVRNSRIISLMGISPFRPQAIEDFRFAASDKYSYSTAKDINKSNEVQNEEIIQAKQTIPNTSQAPANAISETSVRDVLPSPVGRL